ncbi:hypothetical protein Cadr_000000565 [Camelus dromedarius]|uniref:Uncharacterized protein n=1 Tax=Camelus dromedarius TaxID=9838 RepID=A0A5N4EHN2_CAMDR|nr:hypothetical protein Cadr_000000565 [Camelus dromedarius]
MIAPSTVAQRRASASAKRTKNYPILNTLSQKVDSGGVPQAIAGSYTRWRSRCFHCPGPPESSSVSPTEGETRLSFLQRPSPAQPGWPKYLCSGTRSAGFDCRPFLEGCRELGAWGAYSRGHRIIKFAFIYVVSPLSRPQERSGRSPDAGSTAAAPGGRHSPNPETVSKLGQWKGGGGATRVVGFKNCYFMRPESDPASAACWRRGVVLHLSLPYSPPPDPENASQAGLLRPIRRWRPGGIIPRKATGRRGNLGARL